VAADAGGASITLAVDPDEVALVPSNVTARVLPKTLFGERYVDLRLPERARRADRRGDVIPGPVRDGDRRRSRVLDHLLPLLTAVHPGRWRPR